MGSLIVFTLAACFLEPNSRIVHSDNEYTRFTTNTAITESYYDEFTTDFNDFGVGFGGSLSIYSIQSMFKKVGFSSVTSFFKYSFGGFFGSKKENGNRKTGIFAVLGIDAERIDFNLPQINRFYFANIDIVVSQKIGISAYGGVYKSTIKSKVGFGYSFGTGYEINITFDWR